MTFRPRSSVAVLLAALPLAALASGAGQAAAGGPTPVHVVPPSYPRLARAEGVEGRLVVCFTVDADGSTSNAQVRSVPAAHTGKPKLDEKIGKEFAHSALAAVQQWQFKPREVDGKAVATPDVCQPLQFALQAPQKESGSAAAAASAPEFLGSSVKPLYPPMAQYAGAGGKVIVCFTVTAAGAVADARVQSVSVESGEPGINGRIRQEFAASALDFVRHARYRPRIADGKAVATPDFCRPVNFTLRGNAAP